MREISPQHLPEGMHNGYAEWNVLGAHGRRPNGRPRQKKDPEGSERRRMHAFAEHWQRYHPGEQPPDWIDASRACVRTAMHPAAPTLL